jgi:PAS domain S-box-containing protein
VNEAAEEAFGQPRLQICGKRDTELFPAETAEQFIHNDQTALRAGRGIRVIEALRQPDGTIHHSIVSKFAFPAADGSTLLGGMAIDVTDHKVAEKALRDSEQRLRELIEGLSDVVVWEADPQTFAFTFVSEAASKLLGYPRERWLSNPHFFMQRLHPEDRERAAAFRRAAFKGSENELEYRLVAADGRAVWVRDRVYSNEPGGRRVTRGILADITKWKQADQVLRDSEERFRIMTEYAPIMIWMSDANGACVHLNRMLREFWDVENESLSAFDWSQLIHPEDAAEVRERVQAALADRASFTTQARYRNAAGTIAF